MKKFLNLIGSVIIGLSLVACGGTSTSSSSSSTSPSSSSSSVNDANIKVYTRDTTSGTRDGFFTTIKFEEAVKDNTKLVSGYVELASNGDMINGVKNDEFGIGYISLSTLETSGLKGLVYENVQPTEANVLNGTYKLTRNFNYIVRTEYDNTRKEQIVDAYLAFLTTKEAKATVVEKHGILEIKSSDPSWQTIKSNYPICNQDNSDITIYFGGSTSVEGIAKALSAEFSTLCGNFVAEHNHTGSGDAYKRTQGSEKDGASKLDIAFASREFKLADSEPAATESYGKICVDAIVAVVNSKNTVSKVTVVQLKGIYEGTITKWSQLS